MQPERETPSPAPELAIVPPSPDAPPAPERQHRCHGKIAKLPKVLRDQINHMLDDGLPYRLIIENLQASSDPPLPYSISEMDISRWYAKGYQRYLAHQDHLDFLRDNREAACDMVANDDTTTLPEATLQIIASQYFALLGDFSPDLLKGKLSEDPLKYTRFLNVFARLVREIVNLKKHRLLWAKEAVASLPEKDPKRDLSDPDFALLVDHMDRAFKVRRRRPQAPPAPSTAAEPTPKPQVPEPPASSPPPPADDASHNSSTSHEFPSSYSSPARHNQSEGGSSAPDPAPEPSFSSAIENQKSKIENPSDRCQFCGKAHRILPNNQRDTSRCSQCGNFLPPPGQRFVEHCPHCRVQLPNLTTEGTRLSNRCLDCNAPLPLLEPVPNPS